MHAGPVVVGDARLVIPCFCMPCTSDTLLIQASTLISLGLLHKMQVLDIQRAIGARQNNFVFEGTTMQLKWSAWCAITMNPGYAGRTELPDNLKVSCSRNWLDSWSFVLFWPYPAKIVVTQAYLEGPLSCLCSTLQESCRMPLIVCKVLQQNPGESCALKLSAFKYACKACAS